MKLLGVTLGADREEDERRSTPTRVVYRRGREWICVVVLEDDGMVSESTYELADAPVLVARRMPTAEELGA